VHLKHPNVKPILKISIFATGCAGIVAEFVLSTLATYLIGNAVLQWTLVMSLMLFAMGVGSRVSKHFKNHLLDAFIFTEFTLSLLCAGSAVLAYGSAAYSSNANLLIYFWAICIGCLIGCEIPLVTRLNQDYESLRFNIAGIMEKDYYGSLLGGLFFAFVALPYLGMTYTPIILGAINFSIASLFVFFFLDLVHRPKTVLAVFSICTLLLVVLAVTAKPIILFSEQRQYKDKIIYAHQSRYQKIVITQWKDDFWLFINGQEQFSTFDEEKYHEPLVHPAMQLCANRSAVLILGGGDGLGLREVWKYDDVKKVTLTDLDPAMTDLAKEHPILAAINRGSMQDPRLTVINRDANAFLKEDCNLYGVIIIDLPDPDTIDLMHLYSERFYKLVRRHLIAGGVMVTQAASPHFAPQAFRSIIKTITMAGFSVLPYHNQVPTMGEWGWVLAARNNDMDAISLKKKIQEVSFDHLSTRFVNSDAIIAMIHFGKGVLDEDLMKRVNINTEINPVLHRYYHSGAWDMY